MNKPLDVISGLRYLVVEDHGFQRWVVGSMLEGIGARKVFAAPDGMAALDIVAGLDPPIDVIVTDLNMPGMDGIEFIRHLAASGSTACLIVASEQDAAVISAVARMAADYGVHVLDTIRKPVTPAKLKAALQRLPERTGAATPAPAPSALPISEIRHGIAQGQFLPYYQAKADVASGRIVGAEMFARWRHPTRGLVLPGAFVPALEAISATEDLTMRLLREGIADCAGWRAAGFDLHVAVNVSLTSLDDVGFADRIAATVDGQLEPKRITLEITETAASARPGNVLENLTRLRMRGFGLAIDDYGTGYSSMLQLSRMPFTEIKIDRNFVRDAAQDPTRLAMLESCLSVALKMNIPAVAEGVESKEDLALLRKLGCPFAQGYYIARPMSGLDFMDWLQQSRASVRAS